MSANITLTPQGEFYTEAAALEKANMIIGGGIVQEQKGKWIVFSALELAEKTKQAEPPRFYMFVGDAGPNQIPKSKRFVVKSLSGIVDQTMRLRGPVVAAGPKAVHQIGYSSEVWGNPVKDLICGYSPSFIPVPLSYVEENFKSRLDHETLIAK